ncbi:MAG TPA: CDP-glucose 4,6-dehydratase [Ignavibacteriaceae bacterium]|nr:CDP-glucose 4,6-dehydratase [Ignavibacteriaceae bacterium]
MENLEIEKLFGGVYKGKRILVTGHTGFKGSWLIYWLQKLDAKVFGIALKPHTTPNHIELLDFSYSSYIQDIIDKDKINQIIKEIDPEIIFHLAAQPLVRLSYQEPYLTFLTNVIGTVNILESARNLMNLKVIIVVTSDKCYENKEWIWGYRENEPMGGADPYSSSKGCTELVTAAYRSSYFNPKKFGTEHQVLIASVRAGNVIGGGDWSDDRLIPDVVKSAAKSESVLLRYPSATRPWQHVLEPLSGYLTLGWELLKGKKDFADAWNFGPYHESNVTVLELVKESQKYWSNIKYNIEKKESSHEAALLMLDSTKAIRLLNWKPVWKLDETIKYTISWYKNFYEKGEVKTNNTLKNYINDAKSKSFIWALQ